MAVVMGPAALSLVLLCVAPRDLAKPPTHPQWLADTVLNMCNRHNIRMVSLYSCWSTGAKHRVAQLLNEHGVMQTWRLDGASLPEHHREVLTVDLDCPETANILIKASYNWRFTLQNKWLLFSFKLGNSTEDVTVSDILDHYPWIFNLNIFPDSEVVLAAGLSSDVVSLYRTGRGSTLLLEPLGTDRSDLRRAKLIGASVLFQPQVFKGFESRYMPDVDTWPKLHYPVVTNLAEQLNFNLELWAVDDYGWEQNGSFTGVMGQLQRREIDFAATGFFMRSDRLRVVEFTAETYHIRTTILFRQPSLSSVSNIFLLPFSYDVWICCLAYCLIIIIIFTTELTVARKYMVGYQMLQNANFMDIVTLVLGSVCQQGSHLVPERASSRITIFFLSLAALFFFTSYSANIVALLQSPSSALITLTDLVNSPLEVGIQDLNYNRVYFKESIDAATRLLYEKKVKPHGQRAYLKPEDGIRHVRGEMFAFNVETNLGYKIISETFLETEKCALSEMQLFPMPMLSLPLTKHSGYRDLFTQKVRWQRETGILHRNGRLWLPQKPKCSDSRGGTGFISVGLKEFLPALKVLFYGVPLSVALLIFEILYHMRKKKFRLLFSRRRSHVSSSKKQLISGFSWKNK